jgi:hypothetical protein
MIVNGHEIPAEIIKGMEAKILSGSFDHGSLMWFCYDELIKAGHTFDVAHKVSDRAADRLNAMVSQAG